MTNVAIIVLFAVAIGAPAAIVLTHLDDSGWWERVPGWLVLPLFLVGSWLWIGTVATLGWLLLR
jgi:hypothetical protein